MGGEGCGEVVVVQGQEAVQKKCFCAFYWFQVITDQMPVWRFPSVFESSHMLPNFVVVVVVVVVVVCFDLCCFVLVMVIIY